MPKPAQTIFIHTALLCEARPLIEHFRLKKDLDSHPFDVYRHDGICLTVTGIGKCAMAAGVAYTQAKIGAAGKPILLNVGIAGHAEHEIGTLFLAGKIVDADTRKKFYPPLAFAPPCAVETLRTASSPQLDYSVPHLYDMEASAFYETAQRFSSGELIQTLKVVSDNRQTPAQAIQPKQATELIAAQLPVLEAILAALRNLHRLISAPEPMQLQALLERCHFTANERQQLRAQLLRWECLTDGKKFDIEQTSFKNSKEILVWLGEQIDSIDYVL